jgi:hypothetical protein
MTVKELIEELARLPESMEVITPQSVEDATKAHPRGGYPMVIPQSDGQKVLIA